MFLKRLKDFAVTVIAVVVVCGLVVVAFCIAMLKGPE